MFKNETPETRTFFLKTSSCNYQRRTSNADFIVHTQHTPIELNNGVTGVSLVSAAFPQNQPNVTSGHNVLRWQFETTAKNVEFDPTGLSFTWRTRQTSSGPTWSAYQTWTAGDGAATDDAAFTDVASWVSAINGAFGTAYNTLTGLPTANVAWATLPGHEASIVTLSTAAGIEIELGTGSAYLDLIGLTPIPQNLDRVDNFSTTDAKNRTRKYIGSFSPTSYATTLSAGQYSVTDLTATILAAIQAQPTAAPATATNVTAFGEISDIDQRLKLTTTSGWEVIFWGVDLGSTIGPLIGTDLAIDAKTGTGDTTLSHVANLYGPSVTYLHSQLLAGRTTLDGDTGGIVSIVKQIPITAGYREMQCYNNDDSGVPDISFPTSRRKHFSEVDVTLRDQYGSVLDIGAGELEVMWKLYY